MRTGGYHGRPGHIVSLGRGMQHVSATGWILSRLNIWTQEARNSPPALSGVVRRAMHAGN
jgi:hypothetical protein